MVMIVFVMCVLVTAEGADTVVVSNFPQLQARLLWGNAAVLVVLHGLLGEGRQGEERARAVGAYSPSDRSHEEPGNPFFGLIWTACCVITDGSDPCALHFPFEKRSVMINIHVLWYYSPYLHWVWGQYSHVYTFMIKELFPIPQLLLTLSHIKSLVPQAWCVLLPTSLKLTAEVQKRKIKQVHVGITCTQENHRKLGLEGI